MIVIKTQCATYCNVESSRRKRKKNNEKQVTKKKIEWIEVEIERKWWGGKKDNGGIKKIPLNPKNPKLSFRN